MIDEMLHLLLLLLLLFLLLLLVMLLLLLFMYDSKGFLSKTPLENAKIGYTQPL